MKLPKKILTIALSITIVSCDGGGSSQKNSDKLDNESTPGPLLATNGLPDFTTPKDDGSFPKRITPDFVSGFNLSLFSPVNGNAYDQYSFDANITNGQHEITYDFMGKGLNSSLQGMTILFDTPVVRTMPVSQGHSNEFTTFGASTKLSYPYDDNTFYSVKHEIDLDNDKWVIFINGIEVLNSQFNASKIEQIRISLGVIGNTYDPGIRLDIQNFKINRLN